MLDATKAAQILTEAATRLRAEAGCNYADFFSITAPGQPHPLFLVVFSDHPEEHSAAVDAIEFNRSI